MAATQKNGVREPAVSTGTMGDHFCDPSLPPQHARQPLDRRRLEERGERQLLAEHLLDAREQPHRQQRMPAQIEEAVRGADARHAQHALPEFGELAFEHVPGRDVVGAGRPALRRRQRGAVQLAACIQRQGVHRHAGCGQQELRQPGRQVIAQPGRVEGLPLLRDDVGDQALLARLVLAHDHGGVAHRRRIAQHGGRLARLDAEPAYLRLVVHAAQELDVAVGQIAAAVAALVEARGGVVAERVGDELAGRQFGAVQVAARQARAADVQLARHADGHRLQVPVQDVEAGVADRPADGHRAGVLRQRPLQRVRRGEDGGLRRPVAVDDASVRQQLLRAAHVRHRECLPADQQLLDA